MKYHPGTGRTRAALFLFLPLVVLAEGGNPFLQYDEQGRQRMAEGEPARAVESFEEALRANPFDPAALNNLAVAEAEKGDYHSALEYLKRAARLAPNNTEIAANLARLRTWLQNYALAHPPVPEEGEEGEGPAKPRDTRRLPPPAPPLWSALPQR